MKFHTETLKMITQWTMDKMAEEIRHAERNKDLSRSDLYAGHIAWASRIYNESRGLMEFLDDAGSQYVEVGMFTEGDCYE